MTEWPESGLSFIRVCQAQQPLSSCAHCEIHLCHKQQITCYGISQSHYEMSSHSTNTLFSPDLQTVQPTSLPAGDGWALSECIWVCDLHMAGP